MQALILTKGDKQLIFKLASIPFGLGIHYGWQITEAIVDEDTQFNDYSEIIN